MASMWGQRHHKFKTEWLLVLFLTFLVGLASAAFGNRTVLEPSIPFGPVHLIENLGDYEFFEFNASSTEIRAFEFVIARDTTRAPVVVYRSSTTQTPTYFNNQGSYTFSEENSAWTIPINESSQHTTYYFGVTIEGGFRNTGAYFNVMASVFGLSSFYAPNQGRLLLPHGRLLIARDGTTDPSLELKWKPATASQPVFTVYAFESACDYNMNMNILSYVQLNGAVLKNFTVTGFKASDELNTTLSGFSSTVSAFCINLVSSNLDGTQSTIWMAETLYYPHERAPVKAPTIDWKSWSATIWVEIALGSCLLIGAPLGILGHRVWISKRRREKQRLANIQSSSLQWHSNH